jgi:hypothetical protein
MARTRTMLATMGLTAISLTGVGVQAATAQDGAESVDPSGERPPIVHDDGLDASPRVDSTPNLAACYDGQKYWEAGDDSGEQPFDAIPSMSDSPDDTISRFWVYVASDRCNDVNLRLTSERTEPIQAQVCFYPSNGDNYCNQWTEIAPDDTDWNVIATNVLDGTRFDVWFDDAGDHLTGHVAH